MPQIAAGKRPKNAANHPPPGGRRITEAERERRIQVVAGLLAAGQSRAAVVAACTLKLSMSTRTADEYIAEVTRRWAAAGSVKMEEHRGRAIQRLDDLAIVLRREKSWPALIQLERLRADIVGLRRPFEVAVSGPTTNVSGSIEESAIRLKAVFQASLRRASAGAAQGDPEAMRALEVLRRVDGQGGIGVAPVSAPATT